MARRKGSKEGKSGDYGQMWEDYAKQKAYRYDRKFEPTNRIGLTNCLRERMIMEYLGPFLRKDRTALDVGCAAGRQVFLLAERTKKAYGIDISKEFVEFAKAEAKKRKVRNVEFSQSVSERLPYQDGAFNIILCSEVLEHVEDLNATLRDLARVTRKGGRVLITVPNLNADGTLWGRLMRFLRIRRFEPLTDFSMEAVNKHKDAHVREFTIASLVATVERYGLRVEKVTTASTLDFWDKAITGMLLLKPLRRIIIAIEMFLSRRKTAYGRHIILLCRKG